MPRKANKMSATDNAFDLLVHKAFIIPSCEVYGGIGGFYDFGPLGTRVKQRMLSAWRDWCLRQEGFFEIDGSVVVRKEVLVASGHVKSFIDPMVKCGKCQEAFRADHLIEEQLKRNVEGTSVEGMNKILSKSKVFCPSCGTRLPAAIEEFHMMFPLSVGAGKKMIEGYLRPETAQTIFIDFPKIFKATREKLPLGIAQLGRSFRNEISPRQGLIRLREFEQLEIEIFLDPEKIDEVAGWEKLKGTAVTLRKVDGGDEIASVEALLGKRLIPNKYVAYWLAKEALFYEKVLGIPSDKFRFRFLGPDETPFYSKGNIDMEVSTDYGWKETIGNAYRTDHDLGTHAKSSGKDFAVTVDGKKFVPHVVEPSWGLQRMFYAALEHAYRPKDRDREWAWFALPAWLAPYDVNVFSLVKKDGLSEKAEEVNSTLSAAGLSTFCDHSGSIGKRYARADEMGVPCCVTIDYQTKEDGTVTVRDRDTMKQVRVGMAYLAAMIRGRAKPPLGIT